MKNLFEVLRDKENQLTELRNEIKRVEDQIEKLRAAANILSDDSELASIIGQNMGASQPTPVQTTAPAPQPAAAAAASSSGSKRWMP